MHSNVDFQYSGYILALTYINNALAKKDYTLLKELSNKRYEV
jgi:hypothetical protein